MIRRCVAALLVWWMTWGPAQAQDAVWLQVEAQPSLTEAQDRVRVYASRFEDVAGYYLGSGWYGIVIGPYSPADADTLLRQYRGAGQIPRDSFIAFGNNFRQQFWPIGVAAETRAQPLPGTAPAPADEAETTVVETPTPPAPVVDETPRQARASERALDRPAREALQIALKWAGFYNSAIDGAFGRGTRAAMGEWQVANGYEATGVLTTAQRAALLGAYNAVLDGMDLQVIRDRATGIEIAIPTGVVDFVEYEPPFGRFGPSGDLPAQVLLISQEGDRTRMNGLYEILQTLAVVPTDGARERGASGFTINALGEDVQSFTRVTLANNRIKGFMLVWPAGDAQRFERVRAEMEQSFRRIGGVLDPAIAAPDEDQAVDLVAGLEVRKPRLSRTGFYIAQDGTVLTTTEAVENCERVTLDSSHEVEVILNAPERGLAVLRPQTPLAPVAVAAFQTGVPRLQSDIAVAGYPYGGVLVTPALTFGRLADLRGLNGEETIKRLALTAQPGDAGGPVFDNGGAVLGMLLPKAPVGGQVLPPEVSFSVDAGEILSVLDAAGIAAERTDSLAFMPPETLTARAADTTVLVSCW